MGTVHGLLTLYIGSVDRKYENCSLQNYGSFSELLKMYKICHGHHMVNMQSDFVDVFRSTQVDFVVKVSCYIECLNAVLLFENIPCFWF